MCEGRDVLEQVSKRDKVTPEGTWGWANQSAVAACLLGAHGMSPAQSCTDRSALQSLCVLCALVAAGLEIAALSPSSHHGLLFHGIRRKNFSPGWG